MAVFVYYYTLYYIISIIFTIYIILLLDNQYLSIVTNCYIQPLGY
nr:ALPV-225 [Albatrosspox virus]